VRGASLLRQHQLGGGEQSLFDVNSARVLESRSFQKLASPIN
jgi:hypothetical protein